jgi:hypothetical protein
VPDKMELAVGGPKGLDLGSAKKRAGRFAVPPAASGSAYTSPAPTHNVAKNRPGYCNVATKESPAGIAHKVAHLGYFLGRVSTSL